MIRNVLFAIVVLTVLYLTYIQLFFPLLKQGQAEVDILPTIEFCDSMSTNFDDNTVAFANFAKVEYDQLTKAYGDKMWDLTDPDKKKEIKELKGGLVCFCYLMNGVLEGKDEK